MVILIVCSIVPLFPAEAGLYVANPKVQLRDTPLSGHFSDTLQSQRHGAHNDSMSGLSALCVGYGAVPTSHS